MFVRIQTWSEVHRFSENCYQSVLSFVNNHSGCFAEAVKINRMEADQRIHGSVE